jgi:hypothetical protein
VTRDLTVAFVVGLFGLIPLMWQITSTRAQRRDRMTRLSHLRAELELLERLNALQGAVSAGDEDAKRKLDLTISNALSYVMGQYNALSEIAPSKIAPTTGVAGKQRSPREISFLRRALLLYDPDSALGWMLHTVFYVVGIITLMFILITSAAPTPFTLSALLSALVGGVILSTPLVILLLIVRYLARRHLRTSEKIESES